MGLNIYRKRDQQVLIKVSAPHCLAITRPEKCTAEQWHANGKRPSFWQRIARALKRPRRNAAGSAPAR